MSFWQEECPARGPALTHTHWNQCTPQAHPGEESGHYPFQCCHCRGMDPSARGTVLVVQMPPTLEQHIRAQLASLGITGSWGPGDVPEQPASDEHTDDELVEPRMITGEGPKGRLDGEGRWHLPGQLTERDQRRIANYVAFHEWLGDRAG